MMRLICWFVGHKWRRLRKAEAHVAGDRICARCGLPRFARTRKAKL